MMRTIKRYKLSFIDIFTAKKKFRKEFLDLILKILLWGEIYYFGVWSGVCGGFGREKSFTVV